MEAETSGEAVSLSRQGGSDGLDTGMAVENWEVKATDLGKRRGSRVKVGIKDASWGSGLGDANIEIWTGGDRSLREHSELSTEHTEIFLLRYNCYIYIY